MKIKLFLVLKLTTIIFLNACSTIPKMQHKDDVNFTKNGFLDNHHFQVVIIAEPKPGIIGLVNQRESSNITAKNILQKEVTDRIKNYLTKDISSSEKLKKLLTQKDFEDKVISYLEYGSIKTEFFDKRNTAYIIYRIRKKNLKANFNSLIEKLKNSLRSMEHE